MRTSYNPSDYSDYDNLIYFRWKALIRSEEYQMFYKEANVDSIDSMKEERDSIELEIWSYEQNIGCRAYEFLDTVKAYGPPHGEKDMVEEIRDLVSELEAIESRIEHEEVEIMAAAEKKFGLIASDIDDLRPEEKTIEDLSVTFSDYLPYLSETHLGRLLGQFMVKSVSYDDIKSGVIHEDEAYKLFAINVKMPLGMIIKELKKRLRGIAKPRSDRKDFLKWDEAFTVWDLQQKTDNFLLTAEAIRWAVDREGEFYSKEELRGLAWKKYKVADELIKLAGKGKFKGL